MNQYLVNGQIFHDATLAAIEAKDQWSWVGLRHVLAHLKPGARVHVNNTTVFVLSGEEISYA